MKAYMALMVVCLFIVPGCRKSEPPAVPLENFYFTGIVTDSTGSPVQGASVTAYATHYTFFIESPQTVGTATTSKDGMYKITPIVTNQFTTTYTDRNSYKITAGYLLKYFDSHDIANDSIRAHVLPFYTIDFKLH